MGLAIGCLPSGTASLIVSSESCEACKKNHVIGVIVGVTSRKKTA